MLGAALRGRDRVPVHGRPLRGPHEGDPRGDVGRRPPHPRARQPAAADDVRPQHRARERARRLRRAHGRAHRVSARVRRQGHRAPAARRRGRVGHRAPDPPRHRPVVAARRDRAPSWLGAGGSAKWAAEEEKDIDTGVFTGVWRRSTLDEYGGWDDGWPVNQDSELAARFFERGSRIVCMPELGALYVPRDSLKKLAKQYWRYGFYRAKTSRYHPSSMRRSAIFPPALVLAVLAAVIAPRPIRIAAQAGARRLGRRGARHERARRARAFCARRRRPARRVCGDAPLVGARLPARVPGLRAAAGGAGADRRPAPPIGRVAPCGSASTPTTTTGARATRTTPSARSSPSSPASGR